MLDLIMDYFKMPAAHAGVAAWALFIYGIITTWISHSPSKPKSLPDWLWTFIMGGFSAVKVDKSGTLSIDLNAIGGANGTTLVPAINVAPTSQSAAGVATADQPAPVDTGGGC